MTNQEHLDILLGQKVEEWNRWREEHPNIKPDFSGLNLLFHLNMSGRTNLAQHVSINLSGARLSGAWLAWADLSQANLHGADFTAWGIPIGSDFSRPTEARARLLEANLSQADLSEANLRGTDLSEANLSQADLKGTDLSGADLSGARLVQSNLTGANLTNCQVYGIAAWDVQLQEATQVNLIITPSHQSTITVDNLKVAQFIYLLLNNAEIRDVIDTIARKAVLMLGRFTPPRKALLDALREALRTQGYLPILFDFDKPSSRNLTETVRTLAHLSRFIIADLTDPSSIPQELYAIVPTLAVPVRPVLLEGKKEYAMSLDLLTTYHWMLPIHFYKDQADLLATLKEAVIEPAEQKAQELEKR